MKRVQIPPEIKFLFKVFISWMVIFSVLRMGFLWRNANIIGDIPVSTLVKSFFVGARFDIVITSYIVSPLLFWLLVPLYGWQYRPSISRIMPWVLSVLWAPLIFLGLAEWEFYREFHDRFNQLAIQYIFDDPATVISMIWNGFPVIPYLIVLAFVTLIMKAGLSRQLNGESLPFSFQWKRHLRAVLPAGIIVIALLAFGSRGGFQRGASIRWGDAYFSKYTFANHLALNGIFTLSKSLLERGRHKMTHYWTNRMPKNESQDVARRLVLQAGDRLIKEGDYPLFRHPGNIGRTFSYHNTPKNLVVIIMESFSADFAGAFGSKSGATPNFDRLAQEGILFDHFFSQGTHTHQGLFATICSFPNLPGFEYLMQNSLAQQPFRSFISLLNEAGFHSVYVYNGSFTWDNQEGFFRNQGMKYFVGRDDYKNPKFTDPTWGVSDEDMFLRGVEEIRQMTKQGRAFAVLQSLSNHAPFDLPPPAPFNDLKGPDHIMPRLNGIRYSDWTLGRFFDLASREPWFNETLFVVLGDHGFVYEAPKAQIDLTSYNVPLLFYYPGDHRSKGIRINTISSQVDVMPTVLGLMDIKGAHQSWGRDIFRLSTSDKGWAVVKPSGDSQVVGYIKGENFLVLSPEKAPLMYKYRLNPFQVSQDMGSPDLQNEMTRELYGYVQTALNAVLTSHAGVKQAGPRK